MSLPSGQKEGGVCVCGGGGGGGGDISFHVAFRDALTFRCPVLVETGTARVALSAYRTMSDVATAAVSGGEKGGIVVTFGNRLNSLCSAFGYYSHSRQALCLGPGSGFRLLLASCYSGLCLVHIWVCRLYRMDKPTFTRVDGTSQGSAAAERKSCHPNGRSSSSGSPSCRHGASSEQTGTNGKINCYRE